MGAVLGVSRRHPYRKIPMGSLGLYGQSLHGGHRDEWTYDLAWKPVLGFPVTTGWLTAIRRGRRRLWAGLAIDVPVLVACSTRTFRGRSWTEDVRLSDAVLNVDQIARWAPRLGRRVTIARFDGGMHDLTLFGSAVREQVTRELGQRVDGFLPAKAV